MSIAIPAAGRHAYILSAFQTGRSIGENLRAQRHLINMLADELITGKVDAIHYCDGAYKGADEESILVLCSRGAVGRIMNLASMFGQESILTITSDGQGILFFADGRPCELIGDYQACQPHNTDAWTMVRANGECFTFA